SSLTIRARLWQITIDAPSWNRSALSYGAVCPTSYQANPECKQRGLCVPQGRGIVLLFVNGVAIERRTPARIKKKKRCLACPHRCGPAGKEETRSWLRT